MPNITVKLGDKVVKHHKIEQDSVSIGRARDNDIILENLSVSRNHARIRHENGQYVLIDLNSANGLYVNGVRVNRAELVDGDIVSIGKHRLHYSDAESPSAAAPAAADHDSTGASGSGAGRSQTASPEEAEELQLLAQINAGELAAALSVLRGPQEGRVFTINPKDTTIGRHNCDVRVHDISAARRHASISMKNGEFTIRDLGSWQGTIVNGERVRERVLKQGDEIVIGGTVFIFSIARPEEIDDHKPEFPEEAPVLIEATESSAPPSSDRLPVAKIPFSSDELELPEIEEAAVEESDPPITHISGSDEESLSLDEDEFAPFTEEELAELESEEGSEFDGVDKEEMARMAAWEQAEAERLMQEGGGLDSARRSSLIEEDAKLRQEEDAFVKPPEADDFLDDDVTGAAFDLDSEDAEEEKALFGGPIDDMEPGALAAGEAETGYTDEESDAFESMITSKVYRRVEDLPPLEGIDPQEQRRWTRALKNKSKVVRREAARKLKERFGIDYDWESSPE